MCCGPATQVHAGHQVCVPLTTTACCEKLESWDSHSLAVLICGAKYCTVICRYLPLLQISTTASIKLLLFCVEEQRQLVSIPEEGLMLGWEEKGGKYRSDINTATCWQASRAAGSVLGCRKYAGLQEVCWAAGSLLGCRKFAGLQEVCWAAGSMLGCRKYARLQEVCWAAGSVPGCRKCARLQEVCRTAGNVPFLASWKSSPQKLKVCSCYLPHPLPIYGHACGEATHTSESHVVFTCCCVGFQRLGGGGGGHFMVIPKGGQLATGLYPFTS